MGPMANHEFALPAQMQSGATYPATTLADAPVLVPLLPRNGMLIGARYRLQKLLGRGGHGIVFRACDTKNGRDVALKLLLHQHEDAACARRFTREAEILGRLKNPHTVRVLDTGQSADGSLFLVMERVAGHSLEAVLRQRLDEDEVLNEADATAIGVQVLRSLGEAHALGLVHRDVKPSNIMLNEQEGQLHAKVLDFGIAWTEDSSLTASGRVMGTPTYMSPEQCLGVDVDGRSDLYALAAVLYRCVSGRAPFDDPNALTVMYNHVNVPPRDLAAVAKTIVSDGFVDVMMRALAKSPDERFRDAAAMQRALELATQVAPGRSVRLVATQTASHVRLAPDPDPPPPPAHGQLLTARNAALAVMLAGAGLAVTRSRSAEPPRQQPVLQAEHVQPAQPRLSPTPAVREVAPEPAKPVQSVNASVPAQPLAQAKPPMPADPARTRPRAHKWQRSPHLAERPAGGHEDPATVVPPD